MKDSLIGGGSIGDLYPDLKLASVYHATSHQLQMAAAAAAAAAAAFGSPHHPHHHADLAHSLLQPSVLTAQTEFNPHGAS